jgi:hypothetical protein
MFVMNKLDKKARPIARAGFNFTPKNYYTHYNNDEFKKVNY